ncbi:MAG: hypothetical protein V1663_00700 [archaeon]
MSLFKKKDKNQDKLDLPKPDYPTPTYPTPVFEPKRQDLNIPKFPEPDFSESFQAYKPIMPKPSVSNMETIKEAVKPKIEIIRDDLDDDMLSTPISRPSRREESNQQVFESKTIFESKPIFESRNNENPLFVKIDTYEQAIKEIEMIKDNISKINEILLNLDTIKRQEDKEIEQWKERVSKIKDKVMSIDKNLFERR